MLHKVLFGKSTHSKPYNRMGTQFDSMRDNTTSGELKVPILPSTAFTALKNFCFRF